MVVFLYNEFDVLVTTSSISKALASAGWFKKATRRVAKERNADLQDFYLYNLLEFCLYHLVYIDEFGCNNRIEIKQTGWSSLRVALVQVVRLYCNKRYHILPAYAQDGVVLIRVF
jgi:hypothetical protein